ncbi:DUF5134 domain-containing protein [Streptomyces sp. H27-D2]|uniref:DUF5134 domain-containing protein n=1 Tax=Streptomyces sp. H27-D2 TaxID=3046304 RepID=UPI002DB9ED74|nr:DUF5134 domain-containing protein [Streptomyces sp. H27-D2]MEC4019088.1 DUF5134 domain-containing protein [Streptomyces sp. H27-D2]
MHGSPWVGWPLVLLCALTGGYCLLRRRAGPPELRRTAGGDALMGLGMAAMALPAAVLDPRPWGPVLFAVVFGAVVARALPLVRRDRHQLHHAVGAFAMVYMALAMTGAPAGAHTAGHAGHGMGQPAGGVPALTGVLLGYFAVYTLVVGVRMVPLRMSAPVAVAGGGDGNGGGDALEPSGAGWLSRPELATACRVVMGIAMFAMLLTL